MVRRSRLTRRQEAQNLRRAGLFIFLTIGLGLAVIFLGIPALIRLAVFVGDLRGANAPLENQDTLAPAPPQFKPPFEATNSAQINLEGFAEPGATVTVFKNDDEYDAVVAATDGSFWVSDFLLDEGETAVYALVADEAGNESQPSPTYRIIFDNTPPDLLIENPPQISGFFTNQERLEISGKISEPGTVMINEHFVILGSANTFRYSLPLQEGENKILVIVRDEAGNQTEQGLSVTRG